MVLSETDELKVRIAELERERDELKRQIIWLEREDALREFEAFVGEMRRTLDGVRDRPKGESEVSE